MKHQLKAVAGAVTLVASSLASAAIDITAQTTQATADVNDAGELIIGVVVAIAVIAWIRRVIH